MNFKRLLSIIMTVVVSASLLAAPLAVYANFPDLLDGKSRLKLTLDHCASMDSSKYEADSWASFQSALATAQGVYGDSSKSDSACDSARNTLEKTKASMKFASVTDEGNPLPFRVLDKDETLFEMGVGWNLGNTMDGHSGFTPGETVWQDVTTTKEIIKAVHDAGFNTIRIPVTWGNMIDDENGYSINEAWISRVQDIVDYCMSLDMYAIINIHHDGAEQTGWLRVGADDIDPVYEKFEYVWRHIATYFRDYDEHLIFESANELTCSETDKNGSAAKAYDIPVIMNLNQIFVNVVRSTGSNNTRRWLSCVAHYANAASGSADSAFKMPSDSYNSGVGRLMFSAHIYKHTTKATWTYDQVYEVVNQLKGMYNKFKSYPMMLGEYGNHNKILSGSETGFNDKERAWYDEIVTRACQVAKVVPCVWDMGYFDLSMNTDKSDDTFSVWDRAGKKPIFKSITDAMMRGVYLTPSSSNKSYNMKDIVASPRVVPITNISLSLENLTMNYGETQKITANSSPSDSNDVVIWKSENDDIATVSRGTIRARGIGQTTVTAFSQSGAAQASIKVTVLPAVAENSASEVITDMDEYTVVSGKSINIDAGLMPIGSTDTIAFTSSDENIVSVNRLGKVVGVADSGSAYITATASGGASKTVKVNVTKSEQKESINLALHILYSDSANKYWGTELSAPVEVKGNGQYALSFDLAKEISSAAKAAGITEINKLTSIYIKDYDVTSGNASITPLDSCNIRYDEVKVNDAPLTVTNTGFKSALSTGGVLDTGGPINGWDGSAVKEVSASDHVVSFTSVDKPTKIEVKFTLENVIFTEKQTGDKIEATAIEAVGGNEITAVHDYSFEPQSLTFKLTPANTQSTITLISSDKTAVLTDERAKSVSGDGTVSIEYVVVGSGRAKLTAMTDNGLSCEVNVNIIETEGAPFYAAETTVENGRLTAVKARLRNESAVPAGTFKVLIKISDSSGIVTNTQIVDATAENIVNYYLTIDNLNIEVPNGSAVSAYVWESLDNIVPLTEEN